MKECDCREPHERRRIVLTGGPGAGKSAVLELVRQGKADLRQDGGAYSPIFLKPANRPNLDETSSND